MGASCIGGGVSYNCKLCMYCNNFNGFAACFVFEDELL